MPETMDKCEVCQKRLPAYFQGYICSAKCRQKKSRDKRKAQSRAYTMGFQVDEWTKMLSRGTIDTAEARELLHAVWDRLGNFYEQIKTAEAVQEAKK
jgi:predicted nucleic acid-binding Zn ribbon protein